MNRFAIFTFTRAEYGLYRPILFKLFNSEKIECKLYVGGAHILHDLGNTIDEIKFDSFPITDTLDFIKKDDNKNFDILSSVVKESERLNSVFKTKSFDYLIVLGDRWELIPLVYMAMLSNIPVIHLGGGENTIGVVDNQIRHAITKLSHFHIVVNEQYAENISRMGEEDWRIAITGAPGLENIRTIVMFSHNEILNYYKLQKDEPYFLMTFHPETASDEKSNLENLEMMLSILEEKNISVIITYPNLEAGSDIFINILKDKCTKNRKLKLYSNLGMKLYLSTMKYAATVIGNSSSGISEAPFFKIPTINIGDRQKGRMLATSIIQVNDIKNEFEKAINKVLYDNNFKKQLASTVNYYGDGNTSDRILRVIENICDISRKKLLRKDLNFSINKKKWNSL